MLYLHGIGHFHPENTISNEFLVELDIGTDRDWIIQRTGIQSRRTVLDLDYIRITKNQDIRAADGARLYTNAELGRRAAEMAISRAGIDRSEIGLLIAGGSVPETVTPAEGCNIAAALNLDIPAFDLRSACTSFGVALHMLSGMMPSHLPPYVLVVVPESVTRAVDYTDRGAAVIWGDGAAAALISATELSRASITCHTLASNPQGRDKVVVPWAGYFRQEGAAVQAFAMKTTIRMLRGLQDTYSAQAGDRFHFIGHQANLRMLNMVSQACKIDQDHNHHNVTDYGNTASAGAPSVLSELWDDFSVGDHIALVGVGAGLTWTDAMIRFSA